MSIETKAKYLHVYITYPDQKSLFLLRCAQVLRTLKRSRGTRLVCWCIHHHVSREPDILALRWCRRTKSVEYPIKKIACRSILTTGPIALPALIFVRIINKKWALFAQNSNQRLFKPPSFLLLLFSFRHLLQSHAPSHRQCFSPWRKARLHTFPSTHQCFASLPFHR